MDKALNYYQLLGLEDKQNAASLPSQEVKAAYRRALLRHHPDKQLPESATKNVADREKFAATVDDIALAYKVLSDPILRAEYDRWLELNNSDGQTYDSVHRTGLETVDLDDLCFHPDTALWSRSCRCGDKNGFLVSEAELDENVDDGELIVGCKGCSLWLRVLYGIAD